MREHTKSTTLVRVHMQNALVRQIDSQAARLGENRSLVIREAVREYLARNTAGND